jgi:hypothetical protein
MALICPDANIQRKQTFVEIGRADQMEYQVNIDIVQTAWVDPK